MTEDLSCGWALGPQLKDLRPPPRPSSWPLDPALDSSKLGRGAIQPGLALGREGDHPGQRGEDRMDSQRCRHFQRAWADWAPRWQGERRRVRWLGLGRRWGAAQYSSARLAGSWLRVGARLSPSGGTQQSPPHLHPQSRGSAHTLGDSFSLETADSSSFWPDGNKFSQRKKWDRL